MKRNQSSRYIVVSFENGFFGAKDTETDGFPTVAAGMSVSQAMNHAQERNDRAARTKKPGNQYFINRFMDIVQDMNEIGGPDSLDDFIEVLEHVQTELDKEIAVAKAIRHEKNES